MSKEDKVKQKVRNAGKSAKESVSNEVNDITHTAKNDKANLKRKLKYKVKSNWYWIPLIAIGSIIIYRIAFTDFTIPEWGIMVAIGTIAIVVVLYPYGKWAVDKFVEDNRKPLLEVGDGPNEGFGFGWIPEERIGDIEFTNGQAVRRPTDEGQGIEVQKINIYEEQGEQYIKARGTWEGSVSPLEVKRKKENVQNMRNRLEPMAQKGFEYDIKLPELIHLIEQRVTNEIVYQFQGLSNYKGKEIHQEVQSAVRDEMGEIEITELEDMNDEDKDEEKERLEMLSKMVSDDD